MNFSSGEEVCMSVHECIFDFPALPCIDVQLVEYQQSGTELTVQYFDE